ncbi:Protein of unknown function [Chryseobacterium arachidis]|uniref:DUF2489 domain-containing protein n=1 Tax=Chryseobacterium arachidis TaxID=1416778 RepID=A0A1M5BL58_9FLAO|nr:DUF2489 domain-containing protein [Chryseobacterium arachidis]SHF42987.1 Protein of unknown function [Chryseobacterium arachidis]
MNKFDELKRNRFIKKLRSNAIAITTNQIQIHSGYFKMNYLIGRINDIKSLDNIDLDIFKKYYNEIQFHPIGEERKLYNKEYLKKLDSKLELIDKKYKALLNEKCKEIIEKFKDIKDFC